MNTKIVSVFLITATMLSCSEFLNTQKEAPQNVQAQQNKNLDNSFGTDFVEPTTAPFSEKNLLLNIGLNVISPSTDAFSQELQIFYLRLKKSCSQNLSTAAEMKTDLFSDWKNVIYSFHKMDSLSFGPMNHINPTSNLDLRTEIYSWPYSNFCLADKAAYDNHYKTTTQKTLPFNSKSLETVEYLLFSDLNQVKCNLRAQPQLQAWLDLSEKERLQSRCELAINLTEELVTKSIQLKNSWNRTKGNYSKTLIDNTLYTDLKTAINDFSDALYKIETIKDVRLGIPLGKNKNECASSTCPDRIEHKYSDLSLLAMAARLDGFQEGFFGGKDYLPQQHGLDDYLNQSGHNEISIKIQNLLMTAQLNLEKIKKNGGFNEQILKIDTEKCKISTAENPAEPICGFYHDIKHLSITLKTEVLVALSLKSPPVYQGDND